MVFRRCGIAQRRTHRIHNHLLLFRGEFALADADASATAHSKLCGSTVTVDIRVEDGSLRLRSRRAAVYSLADMADAVAGLLRRGLQKLRELLQNS